MSQTLTLSNWYASHMGRSIIARIEHELQPYLTRKPGKNFIVELGDIKIIHTIGHQHLQHVFNFMQAGANHSPNIAALSNFNQLPLADESIDLVILPHTLEYETAAASKAILAEAWRILSPSGYLIILGFNPWSVWSVLSLLFPQELPYFQPFKYHHSAQKIRHWIRQLGDTIITTKTLCYQSPHYSSHHKNSAWLEKFGELLLPYGGGLYLISAQKQIAAVTHLKWRWHWEEVFATKSFVEPSVRGLRRGECRRDLY